MQDELGLGAEPRATLAAVLVGLHIAKEVGRLRSRRDTVSRAFCSTPCARRTGLLALT